MNCRAFMIVIIITAFLFGCMTASKHRDQVRNDTQDRLTVGKVQREIKIGMPSAKVVEVLGSPNVVTTDEQRREVWVYDKISTERVYSTDSGGIRALVLGGGAAGSSVLGGGVGTGYQHNAGAISTTQRTLTIIIKFDNNNQVRDFAYRQSSF